MILGIHVPLYSLYFKANDIFFAFMNDFFPFLFERIQSNHFFMHTHTHAHKHKSFCLGTYVSDRFLIQKQHFGVCVKKNVIFMHTNAYM